jgi:tRNA G37 N-methylase Trm5
MDNLFPYKQDIDYTKLQTTEEGLYSITRKRDGERILSIIKHNVKDLGNKTITDGTACIGGDTIQFAMAFHHVHSIELNLANFNCLVKNINVYELTNITLHQGDCTVLFNWNTDVLYLDPPWGGPDYKVKKELDLMIGPKRIDIWLDEILIRKNRPSHIVLKLPHNYNFKRLNFLVNVEAIKPFRVRNYILVMITVHPFQNN